MVRGDGAFLPGARRLTAFSSDEDTLDAFCSRVTDNLPPNFPLDGKAVTEGVFDVIWREIDPGKTAKIIDQLPSPLRGLWPKEARRGNG